MYAGTKALASVFCNEQFALYVSIRILPYWNCVQALYRPGYSGGGVTTAMHKMAMRRSVVECRFRS